MPGGSFINTGAAILETGATKVLALLGVADPISLHATALGDR